MRARAAVWRKFNALIQVFLDRTAGHWGHSRPAAGRRTRCQSPQRLASVHRV